MAEVPVRVGKRTKWISGLTEKTTCKDIVTGVLISTGELDCPQDQVHLHFALVEVWRGVSKVLSPSASILRIWEAWAQEQASVSFVVKRIRHPKLETEFNQTQTPNVLPSKIRLEEMRQSVREAEAGQALHGGQGGQAGQGGHSGQAASRKKVARRTSSIARRHQRGADTLHPKVVERSREELRVGIQAKIRMMLAQKETIEKELAKLQLLELEESKEPLRPAGPLLPPKPLKRDTADTSQDSGVDSGVVTDDGEAKVNNQGSEETSSNYCYIFDDGLELRPPPENLEALLHSVARVERLNQRLEQTEEEIVALRFELGELSESETRVASPLQCFNLEVAKYREINARLLEEITENRSKLERTGEEHEAAKKLVKRVELDINLVEREGKRLEQGLNQLKQLDKVAAAFETREKESRGGDCQQIEIDFDCLDDEEEVTLTDFGLAETPVPPHLDHLAHLPPSLPHSNSLPSSTLV